MPRDCTARPTGYCPLVLGDVQSRCCGGIQYTQLKMTKQAANKKKMINNHRFTGCREALLAPGTGNLGSNSWTLVSNAGGSGSGSMVLCSGGLSVPTMNITTGIYTQGAFGNVVTPPLRGLYNRSLDFQEYRILSAKLVFVGAVGSTATGVITLAAYTDVLDVTSNTNSSTVSGPNTKTWDVAMSTSREISVPVPVDSSWKRCTSYLGSVGSATPFTGSSTTVVPTNSVADLCFGAISWYASGTQANLTLGVLHLVYDVEFRGVVDSAVNF